MRIREVGSQFVLTPECGITSVTQRPSDVPHPGLEFLRQRRMHSRHPRSLRQHCRSPKAKSTMTPVSMFQLTAGSSLRSSLALHSLELSLVKTKQNFNWLLLNWIYFLYFLPGLHSLEPSRVGLCLAQVNCQQGSLLHVRDLSQTTDVGLTSLNCIRWIPTAGQGFVLGTNKGHLKVIDWDSVGIFIRFFFLYFFFMCRSYENWKYISQTRF